MNPPIISIVIPKSAIGKLCLNFLICFSFPILEVINCLIMK